MAKKFRSEKHIKQRYSKTSKLWTFQVSFKYLAMDGQYSHYTKSFSERDYLTASEAFQAAVYHRNIKLGELASNGLPAKIKSSLDEAFTLMQKQFPSRKATERKQLIRYNKYIKPNYGSFLVDKITAGNIQDCLNSMIDVSSDDTIKAVYTLWKKIYKALRLNNLISRDVTEEVAQPKSNMIKVSKDVNTDVDTLAKVIEGLRNQKTPNLLENESIVYALWTMYYTGTRPAECFAITRDCIDLQNNLLEIKSEVGSSLTEKKTIRQTKTADSVRRIPIVPELAELLKEWMFINSNDYLFCDKDGVYLDSNKVSTKIRNLCNKLGIEFNMYRLRHKFSTDLIIDNTNDPRTIMELMGHNNTNMTISYARSNDEKKKETLNKRKAN